MTAILSFVGCTIEVKPIPKQKKRSARTHYSQTSHTTKTKPHPKPPTDDRINVTKEWINEYLRLEDEHGNYRIFDDVRIEPDGRGGYRVPRTVKEHYEDMIRADIIMPLPSPTAMP